MWLWLSSHAATISGLGAAFGAAIAFVWSVVQFILVRNKDQRAREFDTYHRLIKELVSPESPIAKMYMERQIAIIFELWHFPRYYDVSVRILLGLQESWSSHPEAAKWTGLFDEIKYTLEYIRQRAHNLLGE